MVVFIEIIWHCGQHFSDEILRPLQSIPLNSPLLNFGGPCQFSIKVCLDQDIVSDAVSFATSNNQYFTVHLGAFYS